MGSPRDRIENLRDRVDEGADMADVDRELVRTFSDRLDLHAQTYSDHRHEKLLRHAVIMAEELDDGLLATTLEDRGAAEAAKLWIEQNYSNEETNRDYRVALRVFGKRVAETGSSIETDDEDIPVSLAWISTNTSSDYDPTPDPREMLRWEDDVKPMIDAALNARDAAMIALQFDAGLRGGEFKDLRVGDVQDHDHGLQVTVDGAKDTGRRTIVLIPSVPFVNRWLADHPDRQVPEAPLWSKLSKPDPISDRMVSKAFDEPAGRAEISKPVTLTNFRKSSAAFLARRNLNQAHIEDHHGWVRGSKAATRYIAVFGEDTDREIARLHGKDVSEEEPDSIAPIECITCGRENDADAQFCQQCGQVLDSETAVELEESEDDLETSLAELPPGKAKKLLDMVDVLDDPEIKRALLDAE